MTPSAPMLTRKAALSSAWAEFWRMAARYVWKTSVGLRAGMVIERTRSWSMSCSSHR